jgi:hypothetical protein
MNYSAQNLINPCSILLGSLMFRTNALVFPEAFVGNKLHRHHPEIDKKLGRMIQYRPRHLPIMMSAFFDKEESNNEDFSKQDGPPIYEDSDCMDLCDADENQKPVDNLDLDDSVLIQSAIDESMKNVSKMSNSHISPKQMMRNIELRWSIEESNNDCDVDDLSSCSEPCSQCRGEGTAECTFCTGSGYIDLGPQDPGTMGDQLIRRNGGRTGIECPVCNENGDQICSKCMGSGWIARWRMNLTDTLHP